MAYGLTWAVADVPLLAGAGGTSREQALSGRDLYPAAAAAGWVALATVAAVIATRSWGRILVAVVGLVAGVAGIVAAVLFAADPVGAVTGSLDVADAVVRSRAAGWLLAVVGGLLVVAGAAWTVLGGRAWPGLGSRHERRTRSTRELSAWDAQDAGQDPTEDLVE